MKRLLVNSAAILLGCAGLAVTSYAQVQTVPPPAAAPNDQGTIIIRGPYYSTAAETGDMKLVMPGTMLNDSVYVDGTYVGVANEISDVQLPPGAHDLMLCAPDGTPVYRHNITVGANQITEVRPFQALDNGVNNAPATAYLPPQAPVDVPPAAAYVPQPQPATGQGDLRLNEAFALRNDAVFVDGSYVGTARRIHDLELTPGTHEIALCAPNGDTDFVSQVGISLNETTHLRADLTRQTLNGD